MKLSIILIVIAMITVSCEGPTGPQGEQGLQGDQGDQGLTGEQGLQGDRGVSMTMFDHTVVLTDYYLSELFVDANGLPVQMAGILHDSIKVTSDISVFIDRGTIQIWQPQIYAVEMSQGKIGLADPAANIYLNETLRIIVTN